MGMGSDLSEMVIDLSERVELVKVFGVSDFSEPMELEKVSEE